VDTLRLPTVLRQRPGPDVLNAMIDSATSDRDRSLLTLLMHTGLRMSEVLRLRAAIQNLPHRWTTMNAKNRVNVVTSG
jgi:site-specific recombinase XerC